MTNPILKENYKKFSLKTNYPFSDVTMLTLQHKNIKLKVKSNLTASSSPRAYQRSVWCVEHCWWATCTWWTCQVEGRPYAGIPSYSLEGAFSGSPPTDAAAGCRRICVECWKLMVPGDLTSKAIGELSWYSMIHAVASSQTDCVYLPGI